MRRPKSFCLTKTAIRAGLFKSSFVVDENTSDGEMMMTAMGQGNTLVSPYHMALITQAIANGGTLMEPYLVDKVTNYKGNRDSEKCTEKL